MQPQGFSSVLDDFLLLNLNFSANGLREDYKFHHTFSSEIAKLLKVSPGKLVVMQPEKFQSKHEPKMRVLDLKVSTWSKVGLCIDLRFSFFVYMSSWHLPVGSTPLDRGSLFVAWNSVALFEKAL